MFHIPVKAASQQSCSKGVHGLGQYCDILLFPWAKQATWVRVIFSARRSTKRTQTRNPPYLLPSLSPSLPYLLPHPKHTHIAYTAARITQTTTARPQRRIGLHSGELEHKTLRRKEMIKENVACRFLRVLFFTSMCCACLPLLLLSLSLCLSCTCCVYLPIPSLYMTLSFFLSISPF